MRKAILELLLTLALIGMLFFALSQINWVQKLQIKSLPSFDEKKIEKFLWDNCKRTLDLDSAKSNCQIQTQRLLSELCRCNQWSDTIFQLHINRSREVNAFAYPGGHIVVNYGLINKCNTEGELLSVLSHEVAHINKNHPMELLKREIGVSLLAGILLGNHSGDLVGQISKTLTISSYQRDEESMADQLGLNYLINCHKDPQELINFQKELAKSESAASASLDWIQSHPNWQQRISDVQDQLKLIDPKSTSFVQILTPLQWDELKKSAKY